MSKNAYIVSFKFAPGLAKEFLVLGDNLRRNGFRVEYILSNEYKKMVNNKDERVNYITSSTNSKEMIKDSMKLYSIERQLKKIMKTNNPGFVCVYNPHPINYLPLKVARNINKNCITSIYLHEPFKKDKENFSSFERIYRTVIEYTQEFCYRYMTDVIFPSEYAREMFEYRYGNKYKPNIHIAPLMLKPISDILSNEKQYFSIVGNIDSNRGLIEYIDAIKYATSLNNESIKFSIVTRSNIDKFLELLSEKEKKNLNIVNKSFITDDEITEALNKSFATLLPHKQITQSGNVPTAFRCGTPVIARNIKGFSQHIDHKMNGYLLDKNFSSQELYNAISYIKENIDDMSKNALSKFNNVFSEKNWDDYYSWLIK